MPQMTHNQIKTLTKAISFKTLTASQTSDDIQHDDQHNARGRGLEGKLQAVHEGQHSPAVHRQHQHHQQPARVIDIRRLFC